MLIRIMGVILISIIDYFVGVISVMQEEDENNILDFYEFLKSEREKARLGLEILPKEEFKRNIRFIDKVFPDYWNLKAEELNNCIEILDFNDSLHLSDTFYSKEILLKDIVGTYMHRRYSFLPWIYAVPLLKRFSINFPESMEEKDVLFQKMKNNNFDEELSLVNSKGKYYILSGHHRIIIGKVLGLDFLKANIYSIKE